MSKETREEKIERMKRWVQSPEGQKALEEAMKNAEELKKMPKPRRLRCNCCQCRRY